MPEWIPIAGLSSVINPWSVNHLAISHPPVKGQCRHSAAMLEEFCNVPMTLYSICQLKSHVFSGLFTKYAIILALPSVKAQLIGGKFLAIHNTFIPMASSQDE